MFYKWSTKSYKRKNTEFVGREKNDINSIDQFINYFEEFIIL